MFILKFIKGIFVSLVVLFFLLQMRFMPSYETKLKYRGHNVTIIRDNNFNIPSINAQSKLAALYALGYTTAEDRLFQIHMKRMVGAGRLSELVGQKGIGLDIFFRQLGVGHISQIAASKMKLEDPISYSGYQAYADGVNNYVKNSGLGIQFWFLWIGFQDWKVEDVFIVAKLVEWVQSADGGLTVARQLLAERVGKEKAQIILGWKQQHFVLVNESTAVSDQELRWSGQFNSELEQELDDQNIQRIQNQQTNQNKVDSDWTQKSNLQEQRQNVVIPRQQIVMEEKLAQDKSKYENQVDQTKESPQVQNSAQKLQNKQTINQEYIQTEAPQKQDPQQTESTVNQVETQNTHAAEQTQQYQNQTIQQNSQQLTNHHKKNQETLQQIPNNIQQLQHQQHKNPLFIELQPLPRTTSQNQTELQQVNQQHHIPEGEEIDSTLMHLVDGGAGASNNWAISGKHTASGKPILANDPHLATNIPSDWYQAELRYPIEGGQAYLKGAFIAGTAMAAALGKTGYYAWGCTTQYKDSQDLYRQKVEGNKYLVDGQWRNLIERQERIRVRNGNDRIITVSHTHRGPLISKIIFLQKLLQVPGNVSFAWTGINTDYDFLSFMLNVAEYNDYNKTVSAFRQLDDGPGMNVVYITEDDHIGYQTIGKVPRRKTQNSPFFFDGTTSEYDWDGLITGKDKLYLNDPPKGFIITANSRPASSNFKSGYTASNFQVTSRQHRISKIISDKINSGQKLTVQDSIDIQLDVVDQYCMMLLPYLNKIQHRFSSLFSGWKCEFSAQSHQASIYESFMLKLQFKLQPHRDLHIYGLLQLNHYTYKYIIDVAQKFEASGINLISQSLSQGLQMLKLKFKTQSHEKWQWGKLHLTHYPHLPFSNTPLKQLFDRYHESGGSLNTPNMGKMVKLFQQNFNCQHHAALRMVLTFAQKESKWVIDTGSSSYPFSKFYDDQQLMHKNGNFADFQQKLNDQPFRSQL